MIDSIREKLLSYALGEGDLEWRQEVESLLQHDVLHQKVWKQLLPARLAMETTRTSEPSKLPSNLTHRTMLLVEYSKRMNPPAVTVRGKRDFLQDVFAPHNIPLPGGVPLRGTAWKDATPHESSGGSTRPIPRSLHEKADPPRSLPGNSKGRVLQTRKNPPARAAVAPATSSLRALDIVVLGGLTVFCIPIIILAAALNHHDASVGPNSGSLYQFSQELFGGMEPASYRTSALPKIKVESTPPVGSSGKTSSTISASSSTPALVRWKSGPTVEAIAPLDAAERYPVTSRKSSSGFPSPSRSVSPGSYSGNIPPPFPGVVDSSPRMDGNRSEFVVEPSRLPSPRRPVQTPYRTPSGTPIFLIGNTQ